MTHLNPGNGMRHRSKICKHSQLLLPACLDEKAATAAMECTELHGVFSEGGGLRVGGGGLVLGGDVMFLFC